MSVRFRWRTYLRAALTEHAVIEIVHQFLASWKTEEVARLPAGAWPGDIRTGRELVRETLKIGQAHSQFAGNRASLALLQELLLFMTQAAVRVTQLMPLPGEAQPESLQRPVGGKVLSEEEKMLFEAPPAVPKPVADGEPEA